MPHLPRAAIHLASPSIGEQLKACVSRARALGCRIVVITDDKGVLRNPGARLLDRLVAGEFDLVILRAGVAACEEDTVGLFDPANS